MRNTGRRVEEDHDWHALLVGEEAHHPLLPGGPEDAGREFDTRERVRVRPVPVEQPPDLGGLSGQQLVRELLREPPRVVELRPRVGERSSRRYPFKGWRST